MSLRGVDIGLQVLRVEPGKDLSGRDPVTDIDRTLDDLSAHAKRQFGLHPGLHIAGQGDVGGIFGRFDFLNENPWPSLLNRCFFITRGQQSQEAQADRHFHSRNSHADSFALCARNTSVSLEQGFKRARCAASNKEQFAWRRNERFGAPGSGQHAVAKNYPAEFAEAK
ncbi:hypothetical protein D3C87_1310440 [compost metagenome]